MGFQRWREEVKKEEASEGVWLYQGENIKDGAEKEGMKEAERGIKRAAVGPQGKWYPVIKQQDLCSMCGRTTKVLIRLPAEPIQNNTFHLIRTTYWS